MFTDTDKLVALYSRTPAPSLPVFPAVIKTRPTNSSICSDAEQQMFNGRYCVRVTISVRRLHRCTMLTKLCRLCLPPQYYEMSYGLNIEMHKQVRKMISTCVHWRQAGEGERVIALNVLFASVSCVVWLGLSSCPLV